MSIGEYSVSSAEPEMKKNYGGYDICIPVDPSIGATPPEVSCFGLGTSRRDTVCSVKNGASVNVSKIMYCPHANGTHTETIAHAVKDFGENFTAYSLIDQQETLFMKGALISVQLETFGESGDTYNGRACDPNDTVISVRQLMKAIEKCSILDDTTALVVRTLPNPEDKLHRNYTDTNPAYFTKEAISYITHTLKIRHLLVDLPSMDKENDGGLLMAHRIFWKIWPAQQDETGPYERQDCSITELCYVKPEIPDGPYKVSLLMSPIKDDAVPSRPILFPIESILS
eukprot:Clim_evm4s199 gene=Clim_evmTU4s199